MSKLDLVIKNVFDEFGLKAAHQNDSKVESREKITGAIKSILGNDRISFIEFLGAGVGADYYAKNLNIGRMLLVEKERKDYRKFYKYKFRDFCIKHHPIVVDLQKVDLQEHIRFANAYSWDVINLDFCAYCYEYFDKSDGSPLSLIEEFFKSKALVVNRSMIMTTFMIGGYSLRIATRHNKKIFSTEDEITAAITGLAAKYGFKLQKVLSNKYDSNKKTSMINIGFQVR